MVRLVRHPCPKAATLVSGGNKNVTSFRKDATEVAVIPFRNDFPAAGERALAGLDLEGRGSRECECAALGFDLLEEISCLANVLRLVSEPEVDSVLESPRSAVHIDVVGSVTLGGIVVDLDVPVDVDFVPDGPAVLNVDGVSVIGVGV